MKLTVQTVTLASFLLACVTSAQAENPEWVPERQTWRFQVSSPHSNGENPVEVLLPTTYDPAKKYRVVYVLPVEPGEERKFGDGMKTMAEIGAHNRYDLIVVAPAFAEVPWFGNHASDPRRRQEDYLMKTVVPLIEEHYSTLGTAEGRLLFGFSKSGWGALTLILRNPDFFGYAASWDAPLMFTDEQFGIWGTDENYGSAENMANYLPSRLIRKQADAFKAKTRLVISGKSKFGTLSDKRFPYDGPSHTEAFHELAKSLGVKYLYDPDIKMGHWYYRGWVDPVMELLNSLVEEDNVDNTGDDAP